MPEFKFSSFIFSFHHMHVYIPTYALSFLLFFALFYIARSVVYIYMYEAPLEYHVLIGESIATRSERASAREITVNPQPVSFLSSLSLYTLRERAVVIHCAHATFFPSLPSTSFLVRRERASGRAEAFPRRMSLAFRIRESS